MAEIETGAETPSPAAAEALAETPAERGETSL